MRIYAVQQFSLVTITDEFAVYTYMYTFSYTLSLSKGSYDLSWY